LAVSVVQGRREPLGGWFSETYGKLEPAPMIVTATEAQLPLVVVTQFQIAPPVNNHGSP
jgi:hypothetical protein